MAVLALWPLCVHAQNSAQVPGAPSPDCSTVGQPAVPASAPAAETGNCSAKPPPAGTAPVGDTPTNPAGGKPDGAGTTTTPGNQDAARTPLRRVRSWRQIYLRAQ